MKITKYEHACFTVEIENNIIVVDPGSYTTDFTPSENIVAVAITHEHQDHFDINQIKNILAHSPNATIYAHSSITSQIPDIHTETVQAGDTRTINEFSLDFTGGTHARIFSDVEPVANLGIIINDTLYYPGDSFALPPKPITALALPISAPWLKFSEAAEFLNTVKPQTVFPTHDAILSKTGQNLLDNMAAALAAKCGANYTRLQNELYL
ncbi:MBL fold metallo-hydrolase [Candidatus Saccharibacteria bacterium]|jgi:L-ascorbate metabolism protein UlaG (beta-lactamase superfamily)|nr:MBL fold metallo-hydrolase [Candidatus Saccharibacteria bacterium]